MPPTDRMANHHTTNPLTHSKSSSSSSPRWHPYAQRSPIHNTKVPVDQPLTQEAPANLLFKEHNNLPSSNANMVECGSSFYGSPELPQDRSPPPSYSHVHSPIPTYTYPPCPASAPLPPIPAPSSSSFLSSFTFASQRIHSDPLPRFPSPSHYGGRPLRPSGVKLVSHWTPEDGSKNRHAKGLIDQALQLVATLWDTPQGHSPSQSQSQRSTPNSPPSTSATPELVYSPQDSKDRERDQPSLSSAQVQQGKENIPIHLFVHELLRRSRTSQTVLDTAVAYIKAAGPAVKLARMEGGKSQQSQPIIESETGDSQGEGGPSPATHCSSQKSRSSCPMAGWDGVAPITSSIPAGPKHPSLAISSAHADSPLADPRRTFLAALILASKFLHDKPYSNKAWARLSGLEPREVSRCERALGEALGWKLWLKGQEMQTGLHALRAGESLFDTPSSSSAASSEYQASPAMSVDSLMTPPPSSNIGYKRPSTVPSTPTKGHADMMKRTQSMPNSNARGGLPALYPFALLPMLQSALQLQPESLSQSQPSLMEWSGVTVTTH